MPKDSNLVWLVILTLAQAVLIAFKIIELLSKRKDKEPVSLGNPGPAGNNPHPCKDHSELLREQGIKIAKLETSVEALKDDNKDEHNQLRQNIGRIFKLLNGARK